MVGSERGRFDGAPTRHESVRVTVSAFLDGACSEEPPNTTGVSPLCLAQIPVYDASASAAEAAETTISSAEKLGAKPFNKNAPVLQTLWDSGDVWPVPRVDATVTSGPESGGEPIRPRYVLDSANLWVSPGPIFEDANSSDARKKKAAVDDDGGVFFRHSRRQTSTTAKTRCASWRGRRPSGCGHRSRGSRRSRRRCARAEPRGQNARTTTRSCQSTSVGGRGEPRMLKNEYAPARRWSRSRGTPCTFRAGGGTRWPAPRTPSRSTFFTARRRTRRWTRSRRSVSTHLEAETAEAAEASKADRRPAGAAVAAARRATRALSEHRRRSFVRRLRRAAASDAFRERAQSALSACFRGNEAFEDSKPPSDESRESLESKRGDPAKRRVSRRRATSSAKKKTPKKRRARGSRNLAARARARESPASVLDACPRRRARTRRASSARSSRRSRVDCATRASAFAAATTAIAS